MSKATELAKECGLLSDTGHLYADEIETFFRRAQAMALRDAARVIENSNPQVAGKVQQWADELEAGK